jgi:hypothetical protein
LRLSRSAAHCGPLPARIDGLRNRGGFLEIKADWYYRPEDVVGGRRPFHGAREVFPSDHSDWQPAESVEGHIRVLPLEAHLALPAHSPDDFFTRFSYESVRQRFRPARVPVFCLCAQPWNPDLPMLLCSRCAEFYHAGCVPNAPAEGLGPGRTPAAFVCSECTLAG